MIKSHGEHLFLDKTAKYVLLFSALDVLITTPKKTPKCCDPTNITSWECCHLYSKSSRLIKVIKSHGQHLFLDKRAKYVLLFSPLDVLITTSKKTPKCCDPTNITSWKCCHLYSKSSRPIEVIKSHGEHLFLDEMAKYVLLFSACDVLITTPKKTP